MAVKHFEDNKITFQLLNYRKHDKRLKDFETVAEGSILGEKSDQGK